MADKINNPFLKDGQKLKLHDDKRLTATTFTFTQKMILTCICLLILTLFGTFSLLLKPNKQTQAPNNYSIPNTEPKQTHTETAHIAENVYNTSGSSRKPTAGKQQNLETLTDHYQAIECISNGDIDNSIKLLSGLCYSNSPVISANAAYQLAIINQDNGDFIESYRLGCQALNMIAFAENNSIDYEDFKTLCRLLIAESLSGYSLSLKEGSLPYSHMNFTAKMIDLLEELTEHEAETIAFMGSKELINATEEPVFQARSSQQNQYSYSIVCHNMPFEELLLNISSNGFDVIFEGFTGNQQIRKRPVSLNIKNGTIKEMINKAAGAAGFLARIEKDADKTVIHIINPSYYETFSTHLQMINSFAEREWTAFLLQCDNDSYSAVAHTSLGLLQKQKGQLLQAIAEFQIVANKFYQSDLAPLALLYSAETKASLKDMPSAIEDLTRMVEQYPASEFSRHGYLKLAEIEFETSNYERSIRIHEKIFTTENSAELKAMSAFGAAQGYFQRSDFENAHKWLCQYFELAENTNDACYVQALLKLALASSKLDNPDLANHAFMLALQSDLSAEDYSTAAFGLTESLVKTDNVSSALAVLSNIDTWQLTPTQAIMMLQIKSRIYHRIGLTEKAIAILIDKFEFITDANLRARITLQLSEYLKAENELEKASELLTACIVETEDLQLSHDINIELADICLKQNNYDQTISICHQILNNGLLPKTKQRALVILAKAYEYNNDYQNATLSLLGQVPQQQNTVTHNNKLEQLTVN